MGVTFPTNCGLLHQLALRAFLDTKLANDGRKLHALSAVVFSHMALECFMNELTALVEREENPLEANDIPARVFVEVCRAIGTSPKSLETRFVIARKLLAGKTYDKGALPFQDLQMLRALRNELAHMKPEAPVWYGGADDRPWTERPTFLGSLRSRNLIGPDTDASVSWTILVATTEVASWACATSVTMVKSIVDHIENETLREFVETSAIDASFTHPSDWEARFTAAGAADQWTQELWL
jgi:hypothetical protein